MSGVVSRLALLTTPMIVFIAIEVCAFGCAIAALLNTNPQHSGAKWKALTNTLAPQEIFTDRGWRWRVWAFRIQLLAVVWVLITIVAF